MTKRAVSANAKNLADYLKSLPPGTKTREEIDDQISEVRYGVSVAAMRLAEEFDSLPVSEKEKVQAFVRSLTAGSDDEASPRDAVGQQPRKS